MGLAILPPRLERQNLQGEERLSLVGGRPPLKLLRDTHQEWVKELKAQEPMKETVDAFLQKSG